MAASTLVYPVQTASMEAPLSQNTAPVLEFRCLYTRDLRRKQKRWQDGRLKFHTFNKRIMVYDEKSNFVGDTFWRKDDDLQEEEELELERAGTLIHVGEFIGRRDQDLFELVDKRIKEREERAAARNVAFTSHPLSCPQNVISRSGASHLRFNSLNTVIGSPTGHYGRAVIANTSPFEEKQLLNSHTRAGNEGPTSAKRQKRNESLRNRNSYASNLMGATLNLSSAKSPSISIVRHKLSHTRPSFKSLGPEIIDLSKDVNEPGQQMENRMREERNAAQSTAKLRMRERNHFSDPAMRQSESGVQYQGHDDKFVPIESPSQMKGPGNVDKVQRRDELKETESPTKVSPAVAIGERSPAQERKKEPPQSSGHVSQPVTTPARHQFLSVAQPTENKEVTVPFLPPGSRQTADQPVSALRIKARPARKMMMLISRSNSRPQVSRLSLGESQTSTKRTRTLTAKPNDVVLSQATVNLHSFCQRQEGRRLARVIWQKGDTIHQESSSSLPDTRINNQTIGPLISRNIMPAETEGATVWTADGRSFCPQPQTSLNCNHAGNDETARVQNPSFTIDLTHATCHRDPDIHLGTPTEMKESVPNRNVTIPKESALLMGGELLQNLPPFGQRFNSDFHTLSDRHEALVPQSNIHACDDRDLMVSRTNINVSYSEEMAKVEQETQFPRVAQTQRSQASRLNATRALKPVRDTLSSERDRSRAIESSLAPLPTDLCSFRAEREQGKLLSTLLPFDLDNVNSSSTGIEVKTLPESTLCTIEALNNEPESKAASLFSSTTDLDDAAESVKVVEEPYPNALTQSCARLDPLKAELAKAAPGRTSFQTDRPLAPTFMDAMARLRLWHISTLFDPRETRKKAFRQLQQRRDPGVENHSIYLGNGNRQEKDSATKGIRSLTKN